jgi:hypothetical protein
MAEWGRKPTTMKLLQISPALSWTVFWMPRSCRPAPPPLRSEPL